MSRNPKIQRKGILIFLLLLTLAYGSVIQSSGYTKEIQAAPLQHYLVANPEEVYQRDHFNMSLSITNIYFEEVLNVSIHVTIPSEVEFINSTFSDLTVENDSLEFDYQIGTIAVDEKLLLSFEFNVTSPSTETISFEGVNVSFKLLSGFSTYEITNSVNILLKGIQSDTNTGTLPLKQIGTIKADDIIIIMAYLIPIMFFGLSVVIMRRLRR
ncbi:MAG: hypothetical protein ACTSR4_05865 [Candidatus Hodarchaeales archaeon]